MNPLEKMNIALNRLAKWRTVFAGWQLGTRPKGDPESDAVRDHREATILHRAELSAFANLLIAKGVFTREEFAEALVAEAAELEAMYEKRFPGVKATDYGLNIDAQTFAETTKGWRP